MAPTWFKLVLVVFVIVVLFGRGRISDVMGDFAKGIKSFKKNMTEDDTADAPRPVEQTAPGRLESSLDTRAGAQAG